VDNRYVSVSMTLSDPNPGFKVTVYLQVEYLKNSTSLGQSYYIIIIIIIIIHAKIKVMLSQ